MALSLSRTNRRAAAWRFLVPVFLALLLAPKLSLAHQTPTTIALLDIDAKSVAVELQIPITELALAFGHGISKDPAALVAQHGPQLADYLKSHFSAYKTRDKPWRVEVASMRVDKDSQAASGPPFWELVAGLTLLPPENENTDGFYLSYDVVMHQVMNHRAFVIIRNDPKNGITNGRVEAGTIGWDVKNHVIRPFAINSGGGTWWKDFQSLFWLGVESIKRGTDHLLFTTKEPAPSAAAAPVNESRFARDALVKPPEPVACTLSNGQASTCLRLTLKYKPDNLKIGPFCPSTSDDEGGIWNWDGERAGLYRINREFLTMLAGMGYRFYDDAGKVFTVSDLSAPPKVKNACLNVTAQREVQMTVLLPRVPQMAAQPTPLGTVAKVGLALDGVPIFADAPSVLQTGHMPALDTCGGHIDPGGWYHWHATSTDINALYEQDKVDAECTLPQSARAQFGYAFDGFAMYGSADEDGSVPSDLDECNGHVGPTAARPQGEYHYHATSAFPNLPACLRGLQAQGNFSTTATQGIGSARGGGGPGGQGGPGGPGRPPGPR